MQRFERRGFRRFDNPIDIPKPVNVGEEYDVEITEVGTKGDGIARVKNFVVFVANANKGEKMKIKIKDVRNRFAIGERVGEGAEGVSDGAAGEAEVSGEAEVTEEAEAAEESKEDSGAAEETEEGEEETEEEAEEESENAAEE